MAMAKHKATERGRYVITRGRHIDGEYVPASPESPTILEVEAGTVVDDGMVPLEKFPRLGHLKPHYIPHRSAHAATPEAAPASTVRVVATGMDAVNSSPSDPTKVSPADAVALAGVAEPLPLVEVKGGKGGKRPSDSSPV